jgi:TPR repeat protein
MSCVACGAPHGGFVSIKCPECQGPHYCSLTCRIAHASVHAGECALIVDAIARAGAVDDAACARCARALGGGASLPGGAPTACDACQSVVWCGPMCAAAGRDAHAAACADLCASKFEALYAAACAGHEEAAYNVATVYTEGLYGVGRDLGEAAGWFAAAADAGSAPAAFQLALAFKTGRGLAVNDAESFKWFARAAEAGHVLARFNAGVQLEKGQGVPADAAAAAECYGAVYQRATEDGDAALARLAYRRLEACQR